MAKRRSRSAGSVTGDEGSRHEYALLLVDLINDLEFDGGDRVLRKAIALAKRVAALKARAEKAGVPCIYVNDNFGQWRSDFRRLVDRCLNDCVRGAPLARLLAPGPDDYFVLKPLHSGFYSTSLDLLLRELGSKKLVICGIATEACVLFTASDAYIRGFEVTVPRDGCASESAARHRGALDIMKKMLKADTRPTSAIRFRPFRAVPSRAASTQGRG
jgi:nicotinamidase-related amidase